MGAAFFASFWESLHGEQRQIIAWASYAEPPFVQGTADANSSPLRQCIQLRCCLRLFGLLSEIQGMFWWLSRSSISGEHKKFCSRLIHWGAAAPARLKLAERDPQKFGFCRAICFGALDL